MESQSLGKIYSKNQIDIATFIGGPLIAGYLLSQNFKVFGNKDAAKKAIIISLVSTIILIGVFIFLPESITSKVPNISIAIIPVIITSYIVRQYQSKEIEEYLKKGYSKTSSLGVFGKSIFSLLITLIIGFLLNLMITSINVKYNYGNYLKSYCNSAYNEKNISQDKVYVPEDASCFVYNRLKSKGYNLQQVDKVLTLEFEYQKKIGIVGDLNQTVSKSNTPYDPLPFIKESQNLALSDQQISEILNNEEEYLKLIGVVENKED